MNETRAVGSCETCVHWKTDWTDEECRAPDAAMYAPGDGNARKLHDGDYEPIKAPGKWGECMRVAEFGPRQGSDRFYVIDGSEYHASLNTRSDFGCIEHEPRG